MSGRGQTLMRTRCPACGTVFRVTSEQLRLKAGKVRCGRCESVFNAFDALVADDLQPIAPSVEHSAVPHDVEQSAVETVSHDVVTEPEALPAASAAEFVQSVTDPELDTSGHVEEPTLPPADLAADEYRDLAVDVEPIDFSRQLPDDKFEDEEVVAEVPVESVIEAQVEVQAEELIERDLQEDISSPISSDINDETPEESAQAARQAGLFAVRELNETPAFNRWSAASIVSGPDLGGFAEEPARRAVWPFVVAVFLLSVGLLGQLLYHFRTDVVLHFPEAGALYQFAAVDVPLPRNPELVGIEASDLQADNARGLFVLQATLKNRASYAQAWPALELSLTNTNDTVVTRRVIFAQEYLPPGTKAEAFAANGEIAVRLWIEARDIGAAGYRLYVFYP